jgi:CheY-like chemotaxis protein
MAKVLLADDSITIQKVVELILTEQGFEVKTVNNGQEALTTMLSYTPDIVLADAEMPVLNGYQLCERIKNNSRTKHIPVLLLAGAFEPIDTELAKSVGADGTLTKPFEAQELLNKINSFLKKEEKAEEIIEEITETAEEASVVSSEEAVWEIEEPALEEVPSEISEISPAPSPTLTSATNTQEESLIEEAPEAVMEEVPIRRKEELKSEVSIEYGKGISERTIQDEVARAVREVILNSDITSIIRSAVKDSIEKMLAERLPGLVEEVTRELLRGSLSGISSEIEKVLWETVPDLAEMIITKEIERIKVSLS